MRIDHRTHRQGAWNNCWFRAALDGLAFKRPEALTGMVREGPGRAFVVTFPSRAPHAVAADRADDAPYAAALEAAAHAELGDAQTPRMLSYGLGIGLLTGHNRAGYTNALGAGFAPLYIVAKRRWLRRQLENATAQRRLMVLGGSDGKWTTPKLSWVPPQHCFGLLEYEPAAGTARVRNPYGRDDGIPAERQRDGYGPGEFWVTLDELEGSWCGLTIEDE
ncbi:hypothetical protein R5W23_002861 [Gemmata sp. JC673]|uniref:Uncharacterized protein n=1 Tax=Gemmata algarum TaxID=2975278 RepID=A0ABU5F5P9_9BACT|nr:hypothetical protein [Gemmata algarum]MDY3561583.1 hypothetical protein [Gemmata algarum]